MVGQNKTVWSAICSVVCMLLIHVFPAKSQEIAPDAVEVAIWFDAHCIKNRWNIDNLRRVMRAMKRKPVPLELLETFGGAANPSTKITDGWAYKSQKHGFQIIISLADGNRDGKPVQICQMVTRGVNGSKIGKAVQEVFQIQPISSEREGMQNFDFYLTRMMGDQVVILHTYGMVAEFVNYSTLTMMVSKPR